VIRDRPEDQLAEINKQVDEDDAERQDMDVQYTKITDKNFVSQLKNIPGYHLKRVEKAEI
jgi:hypothetical protein